MKKSKFKIVFLLSLCMLSIAAIQGQQAKRTISGTVFDSKGSTIIGATIMEKGTSNGTVTNVDGQFTLKVNAGATLRISFIGFTTQEVAAADGIAVTLQEDAKNLSEVVVVAYGQQSRVSVTGAISSLETKELKQSPSANLSASLAGRLPGLAAIQTTGRPGAMDAVNLYLRGVGTINGATPLIMIDGVPRDANLLSTLDPNEIASVSILKDASATAVFGVRGANGVILITTRRGATGKMSLSISADYSLQMLTVMSPHLHSYTYAELMNESAQNNNMDLPYTDYMISKYRDGSDPVFYPDRNFIKEFYRPVAPQTRINANMDGGTEKLKYFINVGFINQGSNFKTVKNEQYGFDPAFKMNRYNFRSNLDFQATKNLKISLDLASYLQQTNSPNINKVGFSSVDDLTNEVLGFIVNSNPTLPGPLTAEGYTAPDGTLVPAGMPIVQTPSLRSAWGDLNGYGYQQETRSVLNSSLTVDWDLPFITKGLSAKAMISYDNNASELQDGSLIVNYITDYHIGRSEGDQSYYTVPDVNRYDALELYKSSAASYYMNMQFSLNYFRAFGKHNVTGMVLFQRDNWDTEAADLPYNILGLASRITYNYDDRYLAEVNLGYNGSEQFAPNNRFGFFPAFSAGWVISNEKFLRDNKVLTKLKIRASYGEVGNDKLNTEERFLYITKMGVAGGGYTPSLGRGTYISQGLLGNENIKWEVAKKQNYGLDFQLFSSLSLTADFFIENRSDILISRGTVPSLQGVPEGNLPKVNMGKMKNWGYEFELVYQKVFNKDWSVSIRGNYAFNRNEVLFYDEAQLADDYEYRYRTTGYSLGQPFGYMIDYSNGNGYINTEDELKWATEHYNVGGTPRIGDFLYKDISGDGDIDKRDEMPLGYSNVPEITYGFSVSASWRDLDLSFLFSGIAHVSMAYAGFRYNEDVIQHAYTSERYQNNEEILYPALDSEHTSPSYVSNSFFMLNRSFLRLKSIELGYTLPRNLTKKAKMNQVRIYVNGSNLLTFTKMKTKYIDPELDDPAKFPLAKMVNFGMNIVF
ncbi:MAG: TonB-dependent receptor [Bacteroidales bacterium]|jgi:TonB-linked SusC/RagA family outer membrane protein|nr:TonB-dependent receptor [Bacteroidales bacterium]